MVQSMTAYGQSGLSFDWGELTCEIRSVNHRYLELSIRLPDELRILEQKLRDQISNRLKRGKVDCNIHFKQNDPNHADLPINHQLLNRLIKTAERLNTKLKQATPVSPFELLRWPGILGKDIPEPEEFIKPLLRLVDATLDSVIDTRQREGQKMQDIIIERCKLVRENIVRIQELLPSIIDNQRKKMMHRVQELNTELNNDRLEQELLILLQKMDVTEEMDRLDAHIDEVNRVLKQKGAVGRRLDFLMQEMNRESNTLGAKSIHIDTSNVSVDLKVLIEQMREQIQNIE